MKKLIKTVQPVIQGAAQQKVISLLPGNFYTMTIKSNGVGAGTAKVSVFGTLADTSPDYTAPVTFDNPYSVVGIIPYSDTTSYINTNLLIADDSYEIYKIDAELLSEVGLVFSAIDKLVEVSIYVEDSQYVG